MTVKGNHPLAEIIARKLFCIESVPVAEQRKMLRKAVKAAVEYHDGEVQKLKDLLTEVVYSTMRQQATDERMWTVNVPLSKQLIEDIKQALSTEDESDD